MLKTFLFFSCIWAALSEGYLNRRSVIAWIQVPALPQIATMTLLIVTLGCLGIWIAEKKKIL